MPPSNRPVVAILIPPAMRREILAPAAEAKLAAIATLRSLDPDKTAPADLIALLEGARAAITGWGSPPLTAAILEASPSLALVAHTAGTVRKLVPLGDVERGRLAVSHAAAMIADAVAELVIAQMLLGLRELHDIDRAMKAGGDWFELRRRHPGRLLGAQTVGIVGAGYVGRIVIRLLAAFGCRILVADPLLGEADAAALGVARAELDALMAASDIVSLHAPLLPATEGMIGVRQLAALSDGALVVNAGRAALVDEAALLAELRSGRIRAALDVFGEEPLPAASPFRALPNVILSPHAAGHTIDTHFRQGEAMVDEVLRFLAGDKLRHAVTPAMLSSMA